MTYESLADVFKKFDIFDEAEDMRLLAMEKHHEGHTPEAIQMLTDAAKLDPTNVNIAMDMCQIFLDMDMLAEGAELFTRLPDNIKEQDRPRFLIGQITFKKLALDTDGKQALTEKLQANPEDEDAQFDLALCLIAEQNYDAGMNQLFAMLRQNPNAKGGGAQELAIGVINMLETTLSTLANDFRRQLNNALV